MTLRQRERATREGSTAGPGPVFVRVLGPRPYDVTLALQRRLADERKRGLSDRDLLLLVEHDPVITLGRGARRQHVLGSGERLAALGVTVHEVERGGDVTYHGPGQVVGYPILDLRRYRQDLHWYLRRLEESLLRALAIWRLRGARVDGFTGVWIADPPALEAVRSGPLPADGSAGAGGASHAGGASDADGFPTIAGPEVPRLIASGALRKIASIGVHASRWITSHGFALNVTDAPLRRFEEIVPCGIDGVRMTSLASEGVTVGWEEALPAVQAGFAGAFGVDVVSGDGEPGEA